MWTELVCGILIGICFGTYYDFRPVIDAADTYIRSQLPPRRISAEEKKSQS